jgi:hypothetical protein
MGDLIVKVAGIILVKPSSKNESFFEFVFYVKETTTQS